MVFSLLGLALAATAIAGPRAAQGQITYSTFDPADYSQEVTECDRLAGHREDPFKVVEGRNQSEMGDLAAAVAACEAAVAADPENPRLNYQLGRVLGYSGRGDEAMPYRMKAVEKGYPQSLFVIGYISLLGFNIEQDVCMGGELIRASALAGRFAGMVAFPHYAMEGRFDGCDNVTLDWAEMAQMLQTAKDQTGGFYQEMLVESLADQVAYRAAQAE